jgi:hypothetical protein
VVEHPRRARFLLEAYEPFPIADRDTGQNLDRDIAPEARVLRAVNPPSPISPTTWYGPRVSLDCSGIPAL